MTTRPASALLVLLLSGPVAAAPRELPFTWTAETLRRGADEVEAWLTPRIERQREDSLRVDTRFGWTHGVADSVEAQLSLDFAFERLDLRTERLDPRLTSLWRWTTWRQGSPLAVGALARGSLGFDTLDVEARLLAELRLGRALVALNAGGTRSLFWDGAAGLDTRLEESLGLRYALSEHSSVGLELRARSGWQRGEYQGTAGYAGPTLAFRLGATWLSVGFTAQVVADKAEADRGNGEPNTLRDDERFVARLVVGTRT